MKPPSLLILTALSLFITSSSAYAPTNYTFDGLICIGPMDSQNCTDDYQDEIFIAVTDSIQQVFLAYNLTPPDFSRRRSLETEHFMPGLCDIAGGENCQFWDPSDGAQFHTRHLTKNLRNLISTKAALTKFVQSFTTSLEKTAMDVYLEIAQRNTTPPVCAAKWMDVTCFSGFSAVKPKLPPVQHCIPNYCYVDFSSYTAGDWVGNVTSGPFFGGNACGVTITASERLINKTGGDFGPGGNQVMMFNVTDPTPGYTDLGANNQVCDNPGPGQGSGGIPGNVGENCANMNSAIIISKDGNSNAPAYNLKGGIIKFAFDHPVFIHWFGLLNNQQGATFVITQSNGKKTKIISTPLGPNNLQYVRVALKNVVAAQITLVGPGAITEIMMNDYADSPFCAYGNDTLPLPISV